MNILLYTLKAVASAISEPYLAIMLVVLVFILYKHNKNIAIMQKMIVGETVNSAIELTASQTVIGIIAGAAASMLLSYLGVAFDENSAIDVIFLVSILLTFWRPRFICFSYSGALLGLTSLFLKVISKLMNIPSIDFLKIDIAALLTLIAVLHFVEGILVILDGKRGSLPVFSSRDDKIIGGFAFQRYWALPVALLLIVHDSGLTSSGIMLSTKGTWPILKDFIPMNIVKDISLILFPFYGMIGFNSTTFTKNKEEKTLISGLSIILYSVVLFIFARLAVINIYFQVIALFVAPFAHEAMMYFQRYAEINGEPKYFNDGDGVMVLEVVPNSPANEMGIKSGDILVEMNDQIIHDEEDILAAIKAGINFIWFKVKKSTGDFENVNYSRMNSNKRLGAVIVPKHLPGDIPTNKLRRDRFMDILDEYVKNDD